MDIGALELVMILIVGLIVIGPEKMPEVARNIFRWWSNTKRMLNSAKSQFEHEIGADDIRRQLHNETIMRELNESKEAIEAASKDSTENINRFQQDIKQSTSSKQDDSKE